MNTKLFASLCAVLAALPLPLAQNPALDPSEVGAEDSSYFTTERELESWRTRFGESWDVVRRRETGTARFLFGGATQAIGQPATEADFVALAQHWLDEAAPIHRIDTATLVPESVIFLPLAMVGSTDKVTVQFRQELGGVEVIQGKTNVLFDLEGRLLSIDTTSLPDRGTFRGTSALNRASAQSAAHRFFAGDSGLPPTTTSEPALLIDQVLGADGKRVEPRLVWEVRVLFEESDTEPEGYIYRIDARDGSLVRRQDAIHYFDVSGNVKSMATPGTLPDTAGNSEVATNMPYLEVTSSQGNATTDANGNFTIVGASPPLDVTVSYDGTYTSVNNSAGSDYSLTQTLTASTGNNILMNPSSSAQVTSQANALNWIGIMRDWTRAVNPSDATSDFLAPANVNINDSCNAFYNGSSTNYFLPGGGCENTSYSSVVLHEMGHWLNDRYGSFNGSDGFGEGNADNFSTYILDDPIVGKDFCGSGCHIRDANNNRQYCGDGNGGCYGQVHADGEVLMGACWKVRTRLKNAHGVSAGGAIADALFNSWMNAYNDGQIDSIIEIHWLTLDDDNGNINDGTPNYAHIDGGFRDQGFPGFDLAFVLFSNVTELPDTQDESGPYTVTADIAASFNPPIASADLYYQVGGGAFTQVPMSFVSGTTWTANIPGQASPAVVRYYVTANDNNANSNTFPDNAPTDLLRFVVGIETVFFFEDFESGTNGWTHVSNNGAQDDWQLSSQVGATGAFGKSGDPNSAFSGTNIWGNDLGPSGWNGAYQNNVDNSLRSPIIDLSSATGSTLRFKRWLTIETGQYDQARVLVNGTEVWVNPATGDIVDTSWVDHEIDISALADGNSSVQFEWNLVTDPGVVFGGWNIDDVEIVTIGPSNVQAQFLAAPTSGTVPLSVGFTDQSSAGATSWSWDFGDSNTSVVQNPSYTYNAVGTYTVSLTATSPSGSDTETKTAYITVMDVPPVAEFSGAPTSGVEPLTVNFSDLSTGTISSYAWSFGDGGTSASANPSHTYATPGTYAVSLTTTGPGGADSETKAGYITVLDAPPVAEFSGSPTSGVEPLMVNFSDLSTGNISSYAWTFGDGGTSGLANPSHTYSTPGTYAVSLTTTGPGGADSETKAGYITVLDAPPIAEFSGSPTSGVEPLTVSFSDLSTGNISSYAWTFGDGGTSALANPSHTYATPGTYAVSLTTTGPGGADSETKAGYITVLDAPPVAQFSGSPTSGVEPLTVSFSDLSTGNISSYAWTFGDGGTSGLANPSHTYSTPGTYAVSLTTTGPGGADSETKAGYITVLDAPPVAQFSGSPTSGVEPLTVNFSDLSTGNISSYAWTFGDGGTSGLANPSHTYSTPGTYAVSLTTTGPGGADSETKAGYITVLDAPPVAQFSGSPTSGVEPLTVNFSDLSTGNVSSYAWTFGDGGTSVSPSPSHTYSTPGTYSVELTVTGPGGADAENKVGYIVVQHAPPVADFIGSPTSGVEPLTVNFTDLSTGTVTSLLWNFGDGGSSTLQSPTYAYGTPGTYTVELTVTGPGGSDTETKVDYIVVLHAPPAAAFSAAPTSGLAPLSVAFSDASTGAITSYAWDFGDGATSTDPSPTHVYAAAGVYDVSLTVTGPGGSDTNTMSGLILVPNFQALPDGDQVVPPVATGGTATGLFFLDETAMTVTVSGSYAGLSSNAVSVSVRRGIAGTNGPSVYLLNSTGGTSGTFSGTVSLTADQVQHMIAGEHYLLVHTDTSPFGELRGQVCQFASIEFRNGGTNPASYSANAPVIGGTFNATVDLTTTGHNLAVIVGYTTPLSFTLGSGQTILVNIADTGGELLSLGAQPGPLATFSLNVPTDLSVCNFPIYSQAVHIGGVMPFALSNAQDLTVGY